MGLADFLATAGNHTAIGQIAQAFGGKTDHQREVDDFINKQLPTIADSINKASTRDDVVKGMQALIGSGLKVGIPPNALEKISGMLVQPALQGLQKSEVDKIVAEHAGNPGTPAQPRPQGVEGPLNAQGDFIAAQPPQPEKPYTQNDQVKLANAIGANAAGYSSLQQVPSENTKREAETGALTSRQRMLDALSAEPIAGSPGVSLRGLAQFPSLAQAVPQREMSNSAQEVANEKNLLASQAATDRANNAAAGLDLRRQALELQQQKANGENALTANQKMLQEDKLRGELAKDSQGFKQVRDSYNRIKTSGQNPSPAGDLSMLYNYMKMLDPGSVVRESEFRSAQSAKPLLERVGISWNSVSSLWSGNKMTPGQRKDFLNRANQLYQTEAQQQNQRINETKRVATSYGLDPSRVIIDQGAVSAGNDAGVIKLRRNPQTGKLEPAQ